MGAGSSKQKLGERVLAARQRLATITKQQAERTARINEASPETLDVIVRTIADSFERCSPFSEATLLVAFQANPEETQRILSKSCKKVLSAPIKKDEYEWFMQYVFPSTVWMRQTKDGLYMFERMMKIAKSMAEKIDNSMNSIFEHLQSHQEWDSVLAIKNQAIVERQDDARVGLLKGNGIRDIVDAKQDNQDDDEGDLAAFVDSNVAVTMLTNTAKKLNPEFQSKLQLVMSRYGEFKAGPVKSVERCQSKVENEYHDAQYPKAAKLLDVVRCAVSFNTVEQLLVGYKCLMRFVDGTSDSFELARVKNAFLEKEGGFRDIKVNVTYHSETDPDNPMSLVCEVQLMLNQYLHEKKRIHKLYSILRERTYFEMVKENNENMQSSKSLKELQFETVLNVNQQVEIKGKTFFKCAVDPGLRLLSINTEGSGGYGCATEFFCVNMETKKTVFAQNAFGPHNHHWIWIHKQKYLSLQTKKNEIKMFEVNQEELTFKENAALRICMTANDEIDFTEFDRAFENIFILKNQEIFEKRSVDDITLVKMSLVLEESVTSSCKKNFTLSEDGTCCAIGGGVGSAYFYLIDLESKKQHQFNSDVLLNTYVPCFINGCTDYIAVGGWDKQCVEIWNVQKQKATRLLEGCKDRIQCSASTNNILAVATGNKDLLLWDVRNLLLLLNSYDFDVIIFA